jgi:hypothetical protein
MIGFVLAVFPMSGFIWAILPTNSMKPELNNNVGAVFILIPAAASISCLFFALGHFQPMWQQAELQRREDAIHSATLSMASLNSNVTDEQYFSTLLKYFDDCVYFVSPANGEVACRIERETNGLYSIYLSRGLDFAKSEDLGESADNESSSLMTFLLQLSRSRVDHINKILYTAFSRDDEGNMACYKASLELSHKPVLKVSGDVRAFVNRSKQVLQDTASGKVWRSFHVYM